MLVPRSNSLTMDCVMGARHDRAECQDANHVATSGLPISSRRWDGFLLEHPRGSRHTDSVSSNFQDEAAETFTRK